jgi:hypothetical protein
MSSREINGYNGNISLANENEFATKFATIINANYFRNFRNNVIPCSSWINTIIMECNIAINSIFMTGRLKKLSIPLYTFILLIGFLFMLNYSAVGQLGGGGGSSGGGEAFPGGGGGSTLPWEPPATDVPYGVALQSIDAKPCMADCEKVSWEPTVFNSFTLSNGCKIVVVYTWRIDCENYYNVQILGITIQDAKCNSYTRGNLFAEAHRLVITRDRMGWFKTTTYPQIFTNFQVSLGSCWAIWYVIENGILQAKNIPCNVATCCKKRIAVTKLGENSFSFQDISSSSEVIGICNTLPIPNGVPNGIRCQAVCEEFQLVQYPFQVQEAIDKPNENELNNEEFNNSIEIKVIDNTLHFDVLNLNEEETEIKILVVDYYGNEIANIVKKLDFFHNAIQTQRLDKGNYYYNIYIDGRILHSSNVVIE